MADTHSRIGMTMDTGTHSGWALKAILGGLLVMLMTFLALTLPGRYALVPVLGAFAMGVLALRNPVGRYFRLALTLLSAWIGTVVRSVAFDLGFSVGQTAGTAWAYAGKIEWYIHALFGGLVVFALLLDFRSRVTSGQIQTLTANRLEKYRMELRTAICVSGFLSATIITTIVADIWKFDASDGHIPQRLANPSGRHVYLCYPISYLPECEPLVSAVKAAIGDAGYSYSTPPSGRTSVADIEARLAASSAVIALYIPPTATVPLTLDGGVPRFQDRPSAWIDTTVGAARISNARRLPVLAIHDKRIEVFGLPRNEGFSYGMAFDHESPETVAQIRGAVEGFLRGF